MELGRGGFGVVLRGTYRMAPVAIKRLKDQSLEQQEVFMREMALLRGCRGSRYIVPFVGASLQVVRSISRVIWPEWAVHMSICCDSRCSRALAALLCCIFPQNLPMMLGYVFRRPHCLSPPRALLQGCTVLAMDLMENGSLWMGLTRKGKDGKPLFQWNQRCASICRTCR